MTNEEIRQAAAAVIAKARDDHYAAIGPGAAAFDFAVAAGDRLAEQSLQNACYMVANPDWLTGPATVGRSDELDARSQELWTAIAAELDRYRQRCRTRKYTGWSSASTQRRIRYAD